MARSARQSKIIEIISNNEIETQEELVSALCLNGYDVTQATISRDIKELGLIKIVGETKKYKYAFVGNGDKIGSNRATNIFKESVISVKTVSNFVVIKTLKGAVSIVSGFIDRMALEHYLGCVYGEDTVMIIVDDQSFVDSIQKKISEILQN